MSSDPSAKKSALNPATLKTAVENWLCHIRALAEGIGPRGSATDEELLPKRLSRNVHAVVEPAGAVRRDLVLIGHLDTQRTPKHCMRVRGISSPLTNAN